MIPFHFPELKNDPFSLQGGCGIDQQHILRQARMQALDLRIRNVAAGWIVRVVDCNQFGIGPDHCCDALRYLVVNLELGGGTVRALEY